MVYRFCSVLIALACRFTVHCWFMLYRDRRPQVIFRRWPWAETHRCEMVTKAKRRNKHPTTPFLFALMLWLCQLTALLGMDHNSRTTSATKVDTILSPMQEAWQMRLLNDGLHFRYEMDAICEKWIYRKRCFVTLVVDLCWSCHDHACWQLEWFCWDFGTVANMSPHIFILLAMFQCCVCSYQCGNWYINDATGCVCTKGMALGQIHIMGVLLGENCRIKATTHNPQPRWHSTTLQSLSGQHRLPADSQSAHFVNIEFV